MLHPFISFSLLKHQLCPPCPALPCLQRTSQNGLQAMGTWPSAGSGNKLPCPMQVQSHSTRELPPTANYQPFQQPTANHQQYQQPTANHQQYQQPTAVAPPISASAEFRLLSLVGNSTLPKQDMVVHQASAMSAISPNMWDQSQPPLSTQRFSRRTGTICISEI